MMLRLNVYKYAFIFIMGIIILSPNRVHACGANSPSGVEGQVIFNETYNVPTYCDGTNWIAMSGGDPATSGGILGTSDGLVGYWRFDEGTGITAFDSSGNGNDGTLGGGGAIPTWENSAIIGGNINIQNGQSHIVVPSDASIDNLSQVTISAWVKGVTGSGGNLINKANDFRIDGDSVNDYIAFGSSRTTQDGIWRTANNALSDSEWRHVAVTYDSSSLGNNAIFYINGESVSVSEASTPSGTLEAATGDLYLGSRNSLSNAWNNDIDDFRIYNRVLSQLEIQEIYNLTNSFKTKTVPTGLMAHWRMDGSDNTVIIDSSGNGNDGVPALYYTTNPAVAREKGVINNYFDFGVPSGYHVANGMANMGNMRQISISYWAKPETSDNRNIIVDAEDAFSIRNRDFITSGNDGQLAFYAENWSGTDGRFYLDEYAYADYYNKWTHYTVTYDYDAGTAAYPKFYINGIEQTTVNRQFTPSGSFTASAGTDFYFGRDGAASQSGFDGGLDDFRIYNRILTPAEVIEIYQARDGIRYNSNEKTMQYFDGNQFVSMTPPWPDVTNGLVAHWKLDETSGTTAFDSSSNGLDGAMTNSLSADASNVPGAVGVGLSFNPQGTAQRVDLGEEADLNFADDNAFTFSMWLKPDRAGGLIFQRGTGTGALGSYDLGNYLGQTRYRFRIQVDTNSDGIADSTMQVISPTGTYVIGEWQHVVTRFDGDNLTLSIFINNTEYDVAVTSGTVLADSTIAVYREFAFGGDGRNDSVGYMGAIDDVRAYNRALSDAEITQLYQMGTPVGSSTALPLGCPTVGDMCDDGTIYAGLTPADGTTPMFVSQEDSPTTLSWNAGNTNYAPTSATSNTDGATNTNLIVTVDADSVTGGFQTHNAAQYCYDLATNGATDWYLPARQELDLLYDNLVDQNADNVPGGVFGTIFNFSPSIYWSSSEANSNDARNKSFNLGGNSNSGKQSNSPVRCVRKGPAPRCANPYGLEGIMIYNTDEDVVQYCDGARWVAIGKDG